MATMEKIEENNMMGTHQQRGQLRHRHGDAGGVEGHRKHFPLSARDVGRRVKNVVVVKPGRGGKTERGTPGGRSQTLREKNVSRNVSN